MSRVQNDLTSATQKYGEQPAGGNFRGNDLLAQLASMVTEAKGEKIEVGTGAELSLDLTKSFADSSGRNILSGVSVSTLI